MMDCLGAVMALLTDERIENDIWTVDVEQREGYDGKGESSMILESEVTVVTSLKRR